MDRILLNNGDVIDYEYNIASPEGIEVFVKTKLERRHKPEFLRKLRAERDVVRVQFLEEVRGIKNLKKFVFEQMDKKGYVTDQEVATFIGGLPNFHTLEVYKYQWKKSNRLKNE